MHINIEHTVVSIIRRQLLPRGRECNNDDVIANIGCRVPALLHPCTPVARTKRSGWFGVGGVLGQSPCHHYLLTLSDRITLLAMTSSILDPTVVSINGSDSWLQTLRGGDRRWEVALGGRCEPCYSLCGTPSGSSSEQTKSRWFVHASEFAARTFFES